MQTREVIVENPHGLHMRVAARIAQLTQDHEAQIRLINHENRKVNGSSVLDMLTLGAQRGSKLTFEVEGPAEQVVASRLEDLLANGGTT